MHGVYGWGMGSMGFMWIFWVVLAAAVVWLIAWAGSRQSTRDDSPETILKRRFARGDVDRAEYERRLADLRR